MMQYTASSNIDEAVINMENRMIEMFNMKIEPYLGEGKSGSEVTVLIKAVLNQNITESEHKITILLDNEEIEDANTIVRSSKYTITSEKDSEGFINKVIIKTEGTSMENLQTEIEEEHEGKSETDNLQIEMENESEEENIINDGESYLENALTQLDNQSIQVFNMQVERYLGEGKNASQVNSLINAITDINSWGTERKIDILTDDEEIQNESNIMSSKKYTITCEKDSEGFINKVTILKITE